MPNFHDVMNISLSEAHVGKTEMIKKKNRSFGNNLKAFFELYLTRV